MGGVTYLEPRERLTKDSGHAVETWERGSVQGHMTWVRASSHPRILAVHRGTSTAWTLGARWALGPGVGSCCGVAKVRRISSESHPQGFQPGNRG